MDVKIDDYSKEMERIKELDFDVVDEKVWTVAKSEVFAEILDRGYAIIRSEITQSEPPIPEKKEKVDLFWLELEPLLEQYLRAKLIETFVRKMYETTALNGMKYLDQMVNDFEEKKLQCKVATVVNIMQMSDWKVLSQTYEELFDMTDEQLKDYVAEKKNQCS